MRRAENMQLYQGTPPNPRPGIAPPAPAPAHVAGREGWPEPGGTLVWDSTPAGRGRVVERVTAQVEGEGQTAEVDDPRLSGTQTLAFTGLEDGVGITLSLDYRLKGGVPGLK